MPVDRGIIGRFVRARISPLLDHPKQRNEDEDADDRENETPPRRCLGFGIFDGTNLLFGNVLLHRGSHGEIWVERVGTSEAASRRLRRAQATRARLATTSAHRRTD